MFKLFRKMKYAMLSKIAERKIKKRYGSHISIKIEEFDVPQENGLVSKMVKTEITSYKKDYEKLISNLIKGSH